MNSGGFTDLRLNRGRQGEESFWPSFTDIMTVIVMIFLLAMVTLLLRNMDLLQQLRSSLAAERSAAEQAQSTSDKNWRLKQKLTQLEKEASIIRMRLMDLGEEHNQTRDRLQQSLDTNSSLQTEIDRITMNNARLRADKTELLANRAELERRQQSLQDELDRRAAGLASLQSQQQQKEEELASLRQRFREQQDELGAIRSSQAAQREHVRQLEQEYAVLEKRYNRLVRPARSPEGKHVVQVRYRKQDGRLLVQMKAPADAGFSPLSEEELHRRLEKIHGQHPGDLYVKIIFPDESGLSYTEAWNLTESLLRRYDYYYQEP